MKKLHTSKTFIKMAGEKMHILHPTPGSAPSHTLHKLSKKSGIFQSLGTINFVLFYQNGRAKRRGGHGTMPPPPPPEYAPG